MKALARKFIPLAAAFAFVVWAADAQAQVRNGGFESGTAGWTFGGGALGVGDGQCPPPLGDASFTPSATGIYTAYPHSGSYSLWMGAMGCTPSVSQTVTTLPGQTFNLLFWVLANPDYGANFPNFFEVWVDHTVLYTSPAGGFTNNTYVPHSLVFQSGSGGNTLTFYADNFNGSALLDDVSVTEVVPEPASLVLLATGLLGVAGVMRRRKTQA